MYSIWAMLAINQPLARYQAFKQIRRTSPLMAMEDAQDAIVFFVGGPIRLMFRCCDKAALGEKLFYSSSCIGYLMTIGQRKNKDQRRSISNVSSTQFHSPMVPPANRSEYV
jgi:hypothetical protein